MYKALTGFVAITALFVAGCGDDDSGGGEECVESVVRETDGLSGPLSVADRVQVRAINEAGCAPLNGPLGAFNYFTYQDQESYEAYGAQVTQILMSRGHQIMFGTNRVETLEAPEGAPAGGGSYHHQVFAMPLYTSAGGFMDMILSPEFQQIVPLQQAGARQEDYVFGFQQCHVGCEDPNNLPGGPGLFLLHVFDYEGSDLRRALRDLARNDKAPSVAFGGELVARFEVILDGMNVNSQNRPWGNGTVVYEVSSREEAVQWIESNDFADFRLDTGEDVLVLVSGDPA